MVIPVSEHQDTVGPMARTVRDAARLLQVLTGVDVNDTYTLASSVRNQTPNYPASCRLSGLKNKRIGIARNVMTESPFDIQYTMSEFEQAISTMEEAGAIIIDNADFTAFREWKKRKYNPVTRADFASNIVQFLGQLDYNPNRINSLESLRAFTQNHPAEDYPSRNTANWDVAIDQHLDNKCPEFEHMYQRNLFLGGEGGILGALDRHNLDAVVLPTAVAFEIPSLVGTPIITVPLGAATPDTPVTMEASGDVVEMAPGIPFGISFLGAKWSEQTLIEIAFAFEQRTQIRGGLKRHIEP
jgi:amidase